MKECKPTMILYRPSYKQDEYRRPRLKQVSNLITPVFLSFIHLRSLPTV